VEPERIITRSPQTARAALRQEPTSDAPRQRAYFDDLPIDFAAPQPLVLPERLHEIEVPLLFAHRES